MRQFYKLLLTCAFAVMFFAAYGQHEPPKMCRSDEMRDFHRERIPAASEAAKKLEQFTRDFIQKRQINSAAVTNTTYTIPIVFHVFGTDFAGSSVNDALIEQAILKTNEDFQGLNDDYSTVTPLFQGLRSTLDIQFALAKIDPNGNPSTGINYYPERSGFGNGSGYDDQIKQYAWDNYKYMNVYIMLDLYNDGATNNSGVAWYPDTYMSNNNLSRVVYNGRYLFGNTDKEFASVLTHEFGHWLNLAHTFDNGCSSPGDNVADTPATTSNSGSCNTTTEKCAGAGIPNGENYMDYATCYKMFTTGQVNRMVAALNHASRQPLWQQSNLTATGVNTNLGPYLSFAANGVNEGPSNNGSIDESISIQGQDGAQFAVSGNLTEGVHFTTSNVPAGLAVNINVSNSTTASLSYVGSANAHANSNDASGITVNFLNAAISGGTAAIYNPSISSLEINFLDPYQIVYNNIADLTVSASNTWEPFAIGVGNGSFGAWVDSGNLRFESYEKPMVSQGTSRNISFLAAGTPINSASNWVAGGAYPDEHNVRTNSYTSWDGKTGYMGFQFQNAFNQTLYGWIQIQVASNGKSYTVLDYAYNEAPMVVINAGSTVGTPTVTLQSDFSANTTSVAPGGSVSFTDNSTATGSAISTWNWTFQGGTPATYTGQNPPAIAYNTVGNYEVRLVVTNAAGTSDEKVRANYIAVSTTSVVYCESSGSRSSYEHIAGVKVGAFENNSGAANYSDYTSMNVALSSGNNAITLTPGFASTAYNEYFKVWVDFNQDGDFEDAGELAFDAGSSSNSAVSGNLVVPVGALQGDTRMRVSMKYNAAPSSCGSIGDGEVEDYTAVIGTSTNPSPVASFSANTTSVLEGGQVSFQDGSSNSPTAWSWTFEGGNPATSNSQNPSVTYATAGSYRVTLVASNAAGSNTKVEENYITVSTTGNVSYCAATTALDHNNISNVQFGSINKSSNWEGYADFTSNGTSVSRGQSINLTIATRIDYWPGIDVQAWIDWNNDGDFDDANEKVYNKRGQGPYSTNVTVPSNAAFASTRMRVRLAYDKSPGACENDTYQGEVEDYTISVGSASGQIGNRNSALQLFPNPSDGLFYIGGKDARDEVMVFASNGQLIKRSFEPTVDIRGEQKGIYIVKVIRGSEVETLKLVVK